MICAGYTLHNTDDIVLKVRMPGGYVKKAGLPYFKEEVQLAKEFYKMGYIGVFGVLKNVLFRATPRLLSSRLINVVYKYCLR